MTKSDYRSASGLELFLPICHAVQHAHQKGIIHRDIKPSNVLVAEHDDSPVPQIIDFGVVKATAQRLTERTVFTEFGQVIGTVEYMSPEQARFNQIDVDTRSDIYSLGVLLYELLTGTTPFEQKRLRESAFDEVLRIIREEEPPIPSTRLSASETLPSIAANRHTEPVQLNKEVRGELDWIVMRALEKNRQRRYQTSNELADDLKHYLNDEPVRACPPSRTYRLKKFIRRNKVGATATAGIAAALVLGLVAASVGFVQARRQTEIARVQAVRSEQVAQFLKDMLKGVAPSKALGRDATMLREIVDATATRIDRDLKEQPEVQIELMLVLGQVYFDLQNYGEMEKNARRTIELARGQFGEENVAMADALGQLGRALMFLRKISEAEPTARKAIEMQRLLRGSGGLEEATSLLNLADILRHAHYTTYEEHEKQLAEAESAARAAVVIRRKTLGNDNDETAWALLTWSINLSTKNQLQDAEAAIREAHDIRMRLHGEEHPYTAADKSYLGLALKTQGKFAEAEEWLRKSLVVMEKMDGKGKLSQINSHGWLAEVLNKQGKFQEAEAEYRAAISIGTKEVGSNYLDLPSMLSGLAVVLAKQDKLKEAREQADEAIAICQRHPEIEPAERINSEQALRFVVEKISATADHRQPRSTSAPAGAKSDK